MSLLEQQNLLARLYVDENLRRAFLSDPSSVAGPFGLSDEEIEDISSILPGEIDAFADSLFRKRAREIEKILPLTRRILGDAFEDRLNDFTREVSDRAGSRFEEALDFCDFLQREVTGLPALRDAAKLEHARLSFNSGRKNFIVRRLDHDFRNLPNSPDISKVPARRTYFIWIRAGGRVIHRIF